MRPLPTACLLVAALLALPARATDPVTVYRCTGADGHVTLGDRPCANGARQEVRTLQRPVDRPLPPPAPAAPAPAEEPATPPEPQVVVVHAPQPMYECVTPDGERYTSDTGDGNPRWVPLWTLGYRSGARGTPPSADRGGALGEFYAQRPAWGRVGAPTPRPSPPAGAGTRPDRGRPHRPGHADLGGPGTWIRDTCHALPQAEVCARLVDRREEIRRRFFNAQERERDALRKEERDINHRLAADCGQR